MSRTTFAALLLLGPALLPVPRAAHAARRGVVIAPGELGATDRARLVRAVRQARRSRPAAFEALSRLRAKLPQVARQQRGRLVNLVRPMRSLGADGLLPMLGELALDSQPRGSLSDRAWRGWRVSLLEAVGSLRDPRVAPVLSAILASNESDPAVIRAAATALGRLGSDSAARALARLASRKDAAHRLAAIRALGQCRRQQAASTLASILRRGGDAATRSEVLAALGQVGNLWAWRTPAVARSGEADATRRAAARTLIGAYPRLSAEQRELAAKSLLVISHPKTFGWIAAEKTGKDGSASTSLDQLATRLRRDGLLR